jgi:uncharacterized protein
MYKRLLEECLHEDISSFLFGPRQTGKTTLLRNLKPDIYLDLFKTKEFIQYNRNPSIFFEEIRANAAHIKFVVIDEIQRVPLLLDEVQRCTDQFPHIRFILSGSSARKLKRGSANLLGGRFADFAIFPLTSIELHTDYNLDLIMRYGSLPKIYTLLKQDQKRSATQLLRSYVSTYLSEEIKAEALVRHLDHFQRFLEVSAQQFAREVNQSEMADQAQISVSSVKNYYGILEDTMIGFFLYPYSTSIRKQLTKTPKFYFFDNGVVRAIQGIVNSEPSNQEKGYLFEQLMIQEALRLNRYFEKDLKMSFWRTTSGAEVDLVFSKGNKIVLAVEFKASPFVASRDLSGLKSFAEEYPDVTKFLCAPVERSRTLENFTVLPPSEFLEHIKNL